MDNSRLESYFARFDDLEYVIAYGSVGRGEAPSVKGPDGKEFIYNDLDIVLVTDDKSKIYPLLSKIEEDIKSLYGVKWVDLLVWSKRQLEKKRRTVFYFDLCFKHLLLKGDRDSISKILCPFPQRRIGTYDFFCMYHTRLWAVMSLLVDKKDAGDFGDEPFKSYQCAKAIIAVCDFTLFSLGAYTPLVRDKPTKVAYGCNDRVGKFLSLHLDHAIEVKLNPDSKALDYFIQDPVMVLNLLYIYQDSFVNLIKSRQSSLSFILFNSFLRMEVLAVANAVLRGNSRLLRRNTNRKKLYQLFKDVLRNSDDSGIRNVDMSPLPDLLRELSG